MSYTSDYVFVCEFPEPEDYGYDTWEELGDDFGLNIGEDFDPYENGNDAEVLVKYMHKNMAFAYYNEIPSGSYWSYGDYIAFFILKAAEGLNETFDSMSYDFNEFYTSDLEELEKVLNKAYLDDDDVAEINAYAKKHRHNFGINDLIKYIKKNF